MKYKFNQEIKKQLRRFESHLQEIGFGKDTIRQKTNYLGCFLKWAENEHLKPEDTRYNDLLSFIDYCKDGTLSEAEGYSKKLINNKLRSIRNYYEYLKNENPNVLNPAANLHLKGEPRKIISGIIEFTELETLYQSIKDETLREKRNKTILGLLIYQAITTEELKQLKPRHLKLKEGKIYIPGSRRRNSRILELKAFQIIELYEYINEIRPVIIKQIGEPTPTRKPNKINYENIEIQLFISLNGSENIKNSLLHLFKDVQKINQNIINAQQIRQSTITFWLKNHNLRQVQFMAGHKYVSSTERYQLDNLDNLKDKVEKYHPLN
jgi:integrase/recombinase XerD